MISNNRGLLHLDLTNTRMGSEAALMIAEGLIANNVLEELGEDRAGRNLGADPDLDLFGSRSGCTSILYVPPIPNESVTVTSSAYRCSGL